jgi:two-component system nitrate/nitrite response regulator NarL
MTPIRVAVADDEPLIRSAITEVLGADARFTVVGAVATGDELGDLVRREPADVVLLDVRMPGGGAEGATALLDGRLTPAPAVVAVSAHTGPTTVASMLRAGAVGYLAKGRLAALPDLVARCAAGEVVLAVTSGAEALRQVMGSQVTGSQVTGSQVTGSQDTRSSTESPAADLR